MAKNKKVIFEMPGALEGASAVILAQNAILIGKPILNISINNKIEFLHIALLSIAILNFFNIAANWLSCRKAEYTRTHLFWDILTLGVFFVHSQIIIDMCGTDFLISTNTLLIVTGIFYLIINLLYLIWNLTEISSSNKYNPEKSIKWVKLLKQANYLNIIAAILEILLIIITLIQNNILIYIMFSIWIANWLFIMYRYISKYISL